MKTAELREKTIEELQTLAGELAEQIRTVRLGVRTSTHKQVHQLADLNKTRARVLTLLQQKRTVTHS